MKTTARQRRLIAASALAARFEMAARADEMKGGGNPLDIREIEQELSEARAALMDFITRNTK